LRTRLCGCPRTGTDKGQGLGLQLPMRTVTPVTWLKCINTAGGYFTPQCKSATRDSGALRHSRFVCQTVKDKNSKVYFLKYRTFLLYFTALKRGFKQRRQYNSSYETEMFKCLSVTGEGGGGGEVMVYQLNTDSVCSHQLTPRKRAFLDKIDIFPSFHATQWIIIAPSSPPLEPILRPINP